ERAVAAIATSANFDGYLSVDTVGSVQSTANATGVHRPLEDLGASAYGAASDRTSGTIAFCTQDTLRVWVMDRAGNARKADFTKTPSMAKVGVHPTRPVVVTGGEDGELVAWDLSPTPNGRVVHHRVWNYQAFDLS